MSKKASRRKRAAQGNEAASVAAAPPAESPLGNPEQREERAFWRLAFKIFVLLSVLLAPLTVLYFYRVPTTVRIQLLVSRVTFELDDGAEPTRLLPLATGFRSLTVSGIERAAFTPQRRGALPVNKENRGDKRERLSPPAEVVIEGTETGGASITVERADSGKQLAGRLEAISVRGSSRVSLYVSGGASPTLNILVNGSEIAPAVLPAGAFRLTARQAVLKASRPKGGDPLLDLHAELEPDSPYIQLQTVPMAYAFGIEPAASAPIALLGDRGASVRSVQFLAQSASGESESTLVGPGKLTYIDYPNKPALSFEPHQLLNLDELSGAMLTDMTFDPQRQALSVGLLGTAGKIKAAVGPYTKDLRLRGVDRYAQAEYIGYFMAYVSALVGLLLGWVKLDELLNRAVASLRKR